MRRADRGTGSWLWLGGVAGWICWPGQHRSLHGHGREGGGAAWTKPGKNGNSTYLSLTLDDPSLPDPIFANLIKDADADTYNLIWSRSKKD